MSKIDNSEHELIELKERLNRVTTEMNELIDTMNSMLLLSENKKKFILYNITSGIFRGLGAAIGASFVFAIILKIAATVIELNLPGISQWLSVFINMVQERR